MTYSIHTTETTVTIRKGAVARRSTTCPQLIAAYRSLHALLGAAILPRLWADMINDHRTSPRSLLPQCNPDYVVSQSYVPTSPTRSIPAEGPTMQPITSQWRHLYKTPTQASIWQRPAR